MAVSLETHTPIDLTEFKGLYRRKKNDTVPKEYFQDILNTTLFVTDEVKTRQGVTTVFTKPAIRRTFLYKRLNETPRYLVLDTAGNFYDSLYAAPLITNPAFLDFSVVNINNRAYITFHDRVRGVGPGVYVYQGDGTIRLAAGTAPSSFILNVATSVNSGSIEQGIHLFAVAFESDSGYVSPPGPETFTVYDAPGGFKAIVSNIPIGPAGTVARWILASQVQPEYDGNQLGVELFFLQRVPNNTDTSFEVDFFDADLYVSADYLFDLMPHIPAGTFIMSYQNCLVVGGFPDQAHSILVSKQMDFESFDSTASRLIIDPSDAQSGVTNAIEFRNSLIITKANRSYIVQFSTDDPNTWPVDSLDKSIGTQCFGIAAFLDAKGANTDRFFQADPSGIFIFESGVYKRNEFSYNIADLWAGINKNNFNKVQLALDAENQILYAAVPLGTNTEVSHLLVGFFSDSVSSYALVDARLVRWSIYTFPTRPSSILVDVNTFGQTVLKYGSIDNDIHEQTQTSYLDDGQAINSFIEFGPLQLLAGWVHHYGYLHFRIWGQGGLDITIKGEDDVLVQSFPNCLPLSANPGREFGRKINFVNEKMSLRLGTIANAGDYFNLFSAIVECKPKWKARVE